MSFQQRLTNEYVTLLTIYMCITIYICMRCWDGRGSVDGPITLEKLEMKKVPPKKGPPCLRGPFPLILGPPEIRPEVLGSRAKKRDRADSFFFCARAFFLSSFSSPSSSLSSPPLLLFPLFFPPPLFLFFFFFPFLLLSPPFPPLSTRVKYLI